MIVVTHLKCGIDVLFANAGVYEFARLGPVTETLFDKMFGVSLCSTTTASIPGSKGFEGGSVYGAAKAAIRSFARNWTVDLKNHKVRVNAISPGVIETQVCTTERAVEEESRKHHPH